MLCWMCAHTLQVFFKTFWQSLPPGHWCLPRILISSAAPNPALGTTGSVAEPAAQLCAEAVCYFWLCLWVPIYLPLVLASCFNLAKRLATRFVELDLKWPWSTALHRFAFFLSVRLPSGWHLKEPYRPLQLHRQTKIF